MFGFSQITVQIVYYMHGNLFDTRQLGTMHVAQKIKLWLVTRDTVGWPTKQAVTLKWKVPHEQEYIHFVELALSYVRIYNPCVYVFTVFCLFCRRATIFWFFVVA